MCFQNQRYYSNLLRMVNQSWSDKKIRQPPNYVNLIIKESLWSNDSEENHLSLAALLYRSSTSFG